MLKRCIVTINLVMLACKVWNGFKPNWPSFPTRITLSSLISTPSSWAIPCINAGTTDVKSIDAVAATETMLVGWFWSSPLRLMWEIKSGKRRTLVLGGLAMQRKHHFSKYRSLVSNPHGYLNLARCNDLFTHPRFSYMYSHMTKKHLKHK